MKSLSIVLVYLLLAFFMSWWPFERYELHKYYRDPLSPAAILTGSMHAGVVESYSSMDECLEAKIEAEKDDERIGYTNSKFVCKKK